MVTIRLLPSDRLIHVRRGSPVREALAREGILLDYPCGGEGRCGQCRVIVDPAPETGKEKLTPEEISGGVRLSCRLVAEKDCTIRIPDARLTKTRWDHGLRDRDIVTDGIIPDRQEEGGGRTHRLGFAVDLGTTTVDIVLIDMARGTPIGRRSYLNRQIGFGADVISRAARFHAEPGPVRDAALDTIGDGAREILGDAGAGASDVGRTVVVGNPIMLHILLGMDPLPLTLAPFTPVVSRGVRVPPKDLSWDFQDGGFVETLPLISAYVGADTVAMIVSLGLARESKTTLAIDVGTNGEIVLARGGALTVAATAAGPAFEGAEISCGMRALEGAIYGVSIMEDGSVAALTVGNAASKGICGTGLVSAVSEMRVRGILDASGRIARREEIALPGLRERLRTRDGERFFSLTEDVSISQTDVRKLQLAKGAIRAGIEMLLEEVGARVEDLDAVRLAGKFGAGLDAAAAMRIGLIPAVPLSMVEAVGNSALRGAVLALLSRKIRDDADGVSAGAAHVELGARPDFQARFAECMAFQGGKLDTHAPE